MSDLPPPPLVVLTVPGRVDRVEADAERVERLRAAGRLAAVVRPAPRCAWWADDDGRRVETPPGELVWSGRFPVRRRRARVADAVRAAGGTGAGAGREAAVVYAIGAAAWAEAAAVGRLLDAGVLLGAREAAAIPAARRLVRLLNPTRCVLVAETEALAAALREATDNLLVVEAVPPPVPERTPCVRRREAGEPLLVAVPLAAGAPGLAELLAGLGDATNTRPESEVQLLLMGRTADLTTAYRVAAAAGKLGCVSAAPTRPEPGGVPFHAALSGVHALASPAATPLEEPPAVLEAEARGLPVLEPAGGAPRPGGVARPLPESPGPDAWAAVIGWLLDDPAGVKAAGVAVREAVRAERGVAASDARLLHLAGLVAGVPGG